MSSALPRQARLVQTPTTIFPPEPPRDGGFLGDEDDEDDLPPGLLAIMARSPTKVNFIERLPTPPPDLQAEFGVKREKADPLGKQPYTRVFSTSYGGQSYQSTRPETKSRYLNFSKTRGRKSYTHEEFTDAIEAGTRKNAVEFEAADEDNDQMLSFQEFKNFTNYKIVDAFVGRGPHVKEGSPAQNAARIKAPVLMFHGDQDINVGVGEARLMQARLKAVGGKSELVVYPGLDHQLDDSATRSQMLSQIDQFLRAALGM